MKKIGVAVLLLMLMNPLFAGGQKDSQNEGSGALKIVTTTSIINDVVRNIGGDRIELTGLMPFGQNPHAFEPAPRDMARIEGADIVFVNGLDLEENLMHSIESLDTKRIVEVSHGVKIIEHGEKHDEHDGHDDHDEHDAHDDHDEHDAHDDHDEHNHAMDPHTWFSPLNVMIWADNIAEALSEADPANASYYSDRAEEYKAELSSLDTEIRDVLAPIPEEKRVIVTGHNALGYFARDYHVHVVGTILPGFSTSSEPSAREMAALLDELNEKNVKALFVDISSGDALRKLAESLERESGGRAIVVEFLTGTLRKPGEEADSYLSFMRYNVAQIMYGLQL